VAAAARRRRPREATAAGCADNCSHLQIPAMEVVGTIDLGLSAHILGTEGETGPVPIRVTVRCHLHGA
jgi:hypothetical protein